MGQFCEAEKGKFAQQILGLLEEFYSKKFDVMEKTFKCRNKSWIQRGITVSAFSCRLWSFIHHSCHI